MARAAKGSAFEREICGKLGMWWDGRDDIFWRAAQSGGRAKFRGRKGKDTHGQHGDIIAVDPIGEPLIDLFTIELKRGYSTLTVFDLVDKPPTAAQQGWEKWHQQVRESHEQAGSFSWWIISRRDRRLPMLYMPTNTFDEIGASSGIDWQVYLYLECELELRREGKPKGTMFESISAVLLDQFLGEIQPEQIKDMANLC